MKKIAKRIIFDTIGYAFIVVGVVGLFLPVLQGVLFILIGLYIIAIHAAWGRRLLDRIKNVHPPFRPYFEKAEARIERWFAKFI